VSRADTSHNGFHLLADIGGTNARFAFVTPDSARLQGITRFACADFDSLEAAIDSYLRDLQPKLDLDPVDVCLAVAAPVHRDIIKFTNNPWRFSRNGLSRTLGIPVTVLNDFGAQAHALHALQPHDVSWWQRPQGIADSQAIPPGPRTVVGPGTGFGASTVMVQGEVVTSEPGHISFAPVDGHELQLLQCLWQRHARITPEDLVCGPGLANLYWANSALAAGPDISPTAAEVVERAAAGEEVALHALRDFSAIMGSTCGDIALMMGSLGGIYLSGDMLEKMGSLFDIELFLTRFRAKGAFEGWCREVPVGRLTLAAPGLAGCAAYARRINSQ